MTKSLMLCREGRSKFFFVLILFKDYDDLKFLKWNHYKKIIKKLYGKFFFFKFIIFLMKPLER